MATSEPQPLPPEPPAARTYIELLRRSKWLLIITSLIFGLGAAIESFRAIPIYRASTQLLIERAAPQVVQVQEVLPTGGEAADYYPTQHSIMRSRSLARDVVERLNLKEQPEFIGYPDERGASPIDVVLDAGKGALRQLLLEVGLVRPPRPRAQLATSGEEQDLWIIDAFLGRLRVEPIRNTRLVSISFEGRDPELITQIINTLAEAYMNRTVELKYNAAQTAIQWLRERVGEERQKIEQAERALLAFRERENILSPEGGETILVRKVGTLNDMLIQMRVRRLEMESQAQMLQRIAREPKLVEAFPLVMQNQFVQSLRANYATLELDMTELSERYGFKHPSLQRREAQLATLKSSMNQGIEQVRQSVEMQSQLGRTMEDYVQKLIDESKREIFSFHKQAIQYGVLHREVQAQKEVYNLLLKRLGETSATEQLRLGNTSVIDPAEVPTTPAKPKKAQNTLLGALVGLGFGLVIVFGRRALDTTIRNPDQLEQDVGIPFLGAIMQFRPDKAASGRGELVVHLQPHSSPAEAFRNVRTSMMLARAELPSRALLFTSIAPEEGKTLIVANLAVSLAQAGRKVLLVDADMRKPRIGILFGADREGGGLAQLLGEGASLDDVARPTEIERLSIIPCPTSVTNPSELLESELLPAFIAQAKERYDFILFDSPPLMAVTDAAVLASRVDGVVMVIRGNRMPRELLRRGLATLADVNATVVGGVLNMIDIRRESSYYYGYGYRSYRKYYGRYGTYGEQRSA